MKQPKARSPLAWGFLIFFVVAAVYLSWYSWRVWSGRLMAEAPSPAGKYILRFRTFPMAGPLEYVLGEWDVDMLQCELWDAARPGGAISSCRFHRDDLRAYSASAWWCEARCGHIAIDLSQAVHCLVEGEKVTWQAWSDFVVVEGRLEEWGEEFKCKEPPP